MCTVMTCCEKLFYHAKVDPLPLASCLSSWLTVLAMGSGKHVYCEGMTNLAQPAKRLSGLAKTVQLQHAS